MQGSAGGSTGGAAIDALAQRADDIRLPPAELPGWSSLCAAEYRLCIIGLALQVAGLRVALAAARLAPS